MDLILILTSFITYVGLFHILRYTIKLVTLLYRHLIRKPLDLLSVYGGNDTWAVVTGGSDGIGEQFCRDLAKYGFNICIIARNESKINEKLEDIKKKCGKDIKIKCVVADLGKLSTLAEYEKLALQLKDLDIGLLLLNAGGT